MSEWSASRCFFAAYKNLRNDFPKLKGAWISDEDLLRLLNARYDICSCLELSPKIMNKHFTKEGSKMGLGSNFDKYPLVNEEGHYRIWRRVKKGKIVSDSPVAFYFLAEDNDGDDEDDKEAKVPLLRESENKSDQMYADSRALTNQVLHDMVAKEMTGVKDEVAFHLSLFRLPQLAMLATNNADGGENDENNNDDDKEVEEPPKKVRKKPGPKPKPKPPPAPKVCRGWSGLKYDELIRRSLIVAIENQNGALTVPQQFKLHGPKDFFVRYDAKKEESPFIIYARGHDPSDCPIDPNSYKHCAPCAKASGRLRTYRYLKKKNNRNEDDDEPHAQPVVQQPPPPPPPPPQHHQQQHHQHHQHHHQQNHHHHHHHQDMHHPYYGL